jgi:hypothetical protein
MRARRDGEASELQIHHRVLCLTAEDELVGQGMMLEFLWSDSMVWSHRPPHPLPARPRPVKWWERPTTQPGE